MTLQNDHLAFALAGRGLGLQEPPGSKGFTHRDRGLGGFGV